MQKNSKGLNLTFLVLSLFFAFPAFTVEKWSNVIGNQTCQPFFYAEPKTLRELRQSIKQAVLKGKKVRAVGNGYSISDIACVDGYLLNLKHLNHILSVSAKEKRVRVEAGITLKELNEKLTTYGLALSNQAAISEITLGGALSTAVHGTGHTGTLSSLIKEIELLTADGNLHKLSLTSNSDAFHAASVGLGSLGIIYAVTIQCEDLFYLALTNAACQIEDILANYEAFHGSTDFFQFSWNVGTGKTSIRLWNKMNKLNPTNDKGIISYKALASYVIDENDKDLFSEIAIPLEFLPNAVEKIKQLYVKYQSVDIPMADVDIRFVDADMHSYLSPAAGRRVVYVTFCLPGERNLAFFKEFEDLMIQYQGRPHWGKINFLDYAKGLALYGANFQNFIQIKERLDPLEVFSNSFTERLLKTQVTPY